MAVQVLQTARGGCGQRTGLWVGFDGEGIAGEERFPWGGGETSAWN